MLPDCEPLRTGSARQRHAHAVLRELALADRSDDELARLVASVQVPEDMY